MHTAFKMFEGQAMISVYEAKFEHLRVLCLKACASSAWEEKWACTSFSRSQTMVLSTGSKKAKRYLGVSLLNRVQKVESPKSISCRFSNLSIVVFIVLMICLIYRPLNYGRMSATSIHIPNDQP